jgi:hypothetical protein
MYCPDSFFQYMNLFIGGRSKRFQHANDLLNMGLLRHLMIGLVILLLRETMFTKKKWAQAVDMNHGLNLGVIEVIHETEGNKKGCMGLVWSSGTLTYVHRAVEREIMSTVSFKLIGEAHQDVRVDGVVLDMKELLIYIIKHYGLEAKAKATGCEISTTADGAKLDNYCCHITCGFKLTDEDSKNLLYGRLLFDTIQSERSCITIVLTRIFEFGQELRTGGIPELGYKKNRVTEPQDMKSSQPCMWKAGVAKHIPHVFHLFQKHSADIARPNQLACATCALAPGKLCYCYPQQIKIRLTRSRRRGGLLLCVKRYTKLTGMTTTVHVICNLYLLVRIPQYLTCLWKPPPPSTIATSKI